MTSQEYPDRLYPSELPAVGDLVTVKITEVTNDVVRCQLLEYNRPGLLPLSEISRKQVKNVRHFVRVGVQEAMEVTQVDENKGFIDLSRKHISAENKEAAATCYATAKRMHGFFYRWSVKIAENLIEKILWPHYNPDEEIPYANLAQDTAWLEQVPGEHRERLAEDFGKMFEKAQKHELNVEIICYSLEGVRALQEAVDKALAQSTEEIPLQCNYTGKTGKVGSIFQLSTLTKSADAGTALRAAAETMRESLAQHRSQFLVEST